MRRRRFPFAIAIALAGCHAASSDLALDARLHVDGAQFVPGALPSPSGGPNVRMLNVSNYNVAAGAAGQPLFGTLDHAATACAFALDGDRGYFVIVAGAPDTDTPDLPTFRTLMSFSPALQPGTLNLSAQAVDAEGHFGAPSRLLLTVANRAAPSGALVVTLAWSGLADLDLHVVDPAGGEIWSGHKSDAGGVLDVDSNAQCAGDGLDLEHVVWTNAPPAGHYIVRVDTASLCGAPSAYWRVDVKMNSSAAGTATGVSVDADTLGSYAQGAGRTALEFDVP
jgi:hypothetical protein